MPRGAYYNDNDKYCAAWLRNLIARGLIADGDVDDRDIRDVRPSDLRGYQQVPRAHAAAQTVDLRSVWRIVCGEGPPHSCEDLLCWMCSRMGPHQCSKAMGSRTGQLRAYGNAINPWAAAAFLEAVT